MLTPKTNHLIKIALYGENYNPIRRHWVKEEFRRQKLGGIELPIFYEEFSSASLFFAKLENKIIASSPQSFNAGEIGILAEILYPDDAQAQHILVTTHALEFLEPDKNIEPSDMLRKLIKYSGISQVELAEMGMLGCRSRSELNSMLIKNIAQFRIIGIDGLLEALAILPNNIVAFEYCNVLFTKLPSINESAHLTSWLNRLDKVPLLDEWVTTVITNAQNGHSVKRVA